MLELQNNLVVDEPTFSVSEVSELIQKTLSKNFSNIRIKGEISGLKKHSSGHIYFDIKDGSAVLNCVMWRGNASKIKFKLEDGLEVLLIGSISTYPLRSNYQLIVSSIEVGGVGALMALLEKRKNMLIQEGLFDASRKKPLPFMPSTIGVITSPTGAVIKDILHRISDRFGVHVILYPVAVQGQGASEQITEAINFFNDDFANQLINKSTKQQSVDLLIVARGGGSIEDLWAFNEENVVRAVANSKIPVISAVGHETDTTLIDYVSDKRAPTPTASAEMAVPVKREILEQIYSLKNRNLSAVNRQFSNLERLLKARASALIPPKQRLLNMMQRLDSASEKLKANINFIIANKNNLLARNIIKPSFLEGLVKIKSQNIENYKMLLQSYNYHNVLKRGFAIVRNSEGKLIKSQTQTSAGEIVSVTLGEGNFEAEIKGDEIKVKPSVKKTKKLKNSNQESLF
ncbi:MAG: exodeoxyribonuclease VII large subunit [Rickettsiales bacterium]|nr:exodeoxyribonuclease VII large subunit [Rickettsiales bacterium]